MNFDEIITTLNTLSTTELKQLKSRIDFLLAHDTNKDKVDFDEESIFNALQKVLFETTKISPAQFFLFKRQHHYIKFTEHVEQLKEYTTNVFPKITKIQKLKLYAIYASMLKIYIQRRHLPYSMLVLIRLLPRIPEFLSEQFPSYVESGIIELIILGKGEGEK